MEERELLQEVCSRQVLQKKKRVTSKQYIQIIVNKEKFGRYHLEDTVMSPKISESHQENDKIVENGRGSPKILATEQNHKNFFILSPRNYFTEICWR